jgi:branched-chain amino acid transport system permease protein
MASDQIAIPPTPRFLPWLRRSTLAWHIAIAVAAAVVLAVISVAIDAYRDYQLAEVAAFVVAVAGLTVLIGLSGQISIGNGAFMMVGAYAGALLLMHLQWPLAIIIIAATVIAAAVGAIFGIAAARLRGPYLAGATLMLAVALPFLATRFTSVLGGDQGLIFPISVPGFLGVNFSLQRWQAWVNCAVALIALILLANLARSKVGRSWRAIRDDEIAAALSGLNVPRLQVLAFTVSAACAGLGGVLLASWAGAISPDLFAFSLSIQLLTAAVLGGLGSLPGAVWGSALLVLAPTYLEDVAVSHSFVSQTTSAYIPILAYGVVLIVVMLAFPRGIQGGLARLAGPVTRVDSALAPLTSWRRRSSPAEKIPEERGTT